MEKKIYVAGMFTEEDEKKVNASVSSVTGVSSCVANSSKAQVLVNFDESAAGVEEAITAAITSCGVEVLG
jgi:copper chaperone CopZ